MFGNGSNRVISRMEFLSKRLDGIWFPGKGEEVTLGTEPRRDSGSCKAVVTREKSPLRIACVSVVAVATRLVRDLNPSKFDMKKSRFRPLNNLGIRTGPPRV